MEDSLSLIVLLLLSSLFCGIAGTYPLRSLMLMERDSHEGPFRSRVRYVRFADTGHIQHVALFDWVRRAAGAYEVKGYDWVVREGDERSERFTCPFCLSYWTSALFSIPLVLFLFGISWGLLWVIPVHFTIAIISQVTFRILWGND